MWPKYGCFSMKQVLMGLASNGSGGLELDGPNMDVLAWSCFLWVWLLMVLVG